MKEITFTWVGGGGGGIQFRLLQIIPKLLGRSVIQSIIKLTFLYLTYM